MTSQPSNDLIKVGVFLSRTPVQDAFWNMCRGPRGADGDLQLVGPDRTADHILCIGTPIPENGRPGRRGLMRVVRGRGSDRERFAACFKRLKRSRDDVTVLFYEPPGIVSDIEYEVAREYAGRVFGPDPRASDPITLPAMWRAPLSPQAVLALPPGEKSADLAIVTSGKNRLPGHRARLDFLRRLRREAIPFDLYGVDLPPDLEGKGPVEFKHDILYRARFTLAIENDADTELYVTEKLWDPLVAWSIPIYYGSMAAEAFLSPDAYIRLPDLEDGGIGVISHALQAPEREARMTGIANARTRIVNELNLVHWLRGVLHKLQSPRP